MCVHAKIEETSQQTSKETNERQRTQKACRSKHMNIDLSINMARSLKTCGSKHKHEKKSLKTCGSKHKHENEPKNMSKHKHEKLTYPNPRRVVQQHQSDKS